MAALSGCRSPAPPALATPSPRWYTIAIPVTSVPAAATLAAGRTGTDPRGTLDDVVIGDHRRGGARPTGGSDGHLCRPGSARRRRRI